MNLSPMTVWSILYMIVYALKEGEAKPYIGKLVKIWDLKNKQRKVKIPWFYYPEQISNFLEGESMLENELFLATGVGKGLTNINSLVRLLRLFCMFF